MNMNPSSYTNSSMLPILINLDLVIVLFID